MFFSRWLPLVLLALAIYAHPVAAAQPQGETLRKALSLLKAERPLEAETMLAGIDEGDSDYGAARTLLGFLLLQRAAAGEAERVFTQVLAADPQNAPARFGLGIALMRRGAPGRAALELEKAGTDPVVGHRARADWIRSLYLAGKEDEAMRTAQALAREVPEAAEYQSALGFLLQTRSERKAALTHYRRAVELAPGHLSYYFSVIGLLRLDGEWSEVLRYAQQALALDRNHPLLYQEMAAAYGGLGDRRQADAASLRAHHCYEAEVRYIRSVHARRSGSEPEAERLLRDAVGLNTTLGKAWVDLGELLRSRGRLGEACEAFLMALETEPENVGAHLGLAAVLKSQGKADDARKVYDRAIAWGLSSADLFAGLAGSYLLQGRAPDAAEAMLRAVRELPDNPDLLAYLGYLQEAVGRKVDAAETYAEALRLHAGQVEALQGKAGILLDQGESERAREIYSGLTAAAPHNTEAWLGSIRSAKSSGDARGAYAACLSCLEHNPEDLQCREQAAFLALELRMYDEAGHQLEFLLRNGHSSRDILNGLGFARMNRGDLEGAIRVFESSRDRYGTDSWIETNLGYVSRCRGDLIAAAGHYRRAAELDPSDPEKHYDLAFTLHLSGKYESAAQSLEAALRLRPGWGTAHYNLAMAYWNLRRHPLALAHARLAAQKGVARARAVVEILARNQAAAGR